MMVFCSLLEYAAVGYISKRMKLVRARKESRYWRLFRSTRTMSLQNADSSSPNRASSETNSLRSFLLQQHNIPSFLLFHGPNLKLVHPRGTTHNDICSTHHTSFSLTACFQNEDAVPNELTPMLGRSNSQASVFLYQSGHQPVLVLYVLIVYSGSDNRRWLRPLLEVAATVEYRQILQIPVSFRNGTQRSFRTVRLFPDFRAFQCQLLGLLHTPEPDSGGATEQRNSLKSSLFLPCSVPKFSFHCTHLHHSLFCISEPRPPNPPRHFCSKQTRRNREKQSEFWERTHLQTGTRPKISITIGARSAPIWRRPPSSLTLSNCHSSSRHYTSWTPPKRRLLQVNPAFDCDVQPIRKFRKVCPSRAGSYSRPEHGLLHNEHRHPLHSYSHNLLGLVLA